MISARFENAPYRSPEEYANAIAEYLKLKINRSFQVFTGRIELADELIKNVTEAGIFRKWLFFYQYVGDVTYTRIKTRPFGLVWISLKDGWLSQNELESIVSQVKSPQITN